jgi:hypothetical protein
LIAVRAMIPRVAPPHLPPPLPHTCCSSHRAAHQTPPGITRRSVVSDAAPAFEMEFPVYNPCRFSLQFILPYEVLGPKMLHEIDPHM